MDASPVQLLCEQLERKNVNSSAIDSLLKDPRKIATMATTRPSSYGLSLKASRENMQSALARSRLRPLHVLVIVPTTPSSEEADPSRRRPGRAVSYHGYDAVIYGAMRGKLDTVKALRHGGADRTTSSRARLP